MFLEPNGRSIDGDGQIVKGRPSAAGRQRGEAALLRWVHDQPRLAAAALAADTAYGLYMPVRDIAVLTALRGLDMAALVPAASAHWFTMDDLLGKLPAGDYTRTVLAQNPVFPGCGGLARRKMQPGGICYRITPAGKGRCPAP